MQEAKDGKGSGQAHVGDVGRNARVGTLLVLVLTGMLLRAWAPEATVLAPMPAAPSATSHGPMPGSLEQSLGLLGLMPLCARRSALRVKRRG